MKGIRISLQLDEDASNDLLFLRQELGEKSVTAVLKYSLENTAQELRDQLRAKKQKQIWLSSGFIGCIEGPEDLSVTDS